MNQIEWQEQFAKRVLGLLSFQRYFADDPRARSWRSQKARWNVKLKAQRELIEAGYPEQAAWWIVNDAIDYASLLYNER